VSSPFDASPQQANTKRGEGGIASDEWDGLDRALGREHAVEPIAVRLRPASGSLSVRDGDRQLGQTRSFHPSRYVASEQLS
jgi:hypothetical protein